MCVHTCQLRHVVYNCNDILWATFLWVHHVVYTLSYFVHLPKLRSEAAAKRVISFSSSEILRHKKDNCDVLSSRDDPWWWCGRWGIPPTPISKSSKRTRRKWKQRSGSPPNVAAPRKYDLHLNCKERFRRNCVGMFCRHLTETRVQEVIYTRRNRNS